MPVTLAIDCTFTTCRPTGFFSSSSLEAWEGIMKNLKPDYNLRSSIIELLWSVITTCYKSYPPQEQFLHSHNVSTTLIMMTSTRVTFVLCISASWIAFARKSLQQLDFIARGKLRAHFNIHQNQKDFALSLEKGGSDQSSFHFCTLHVEWLVVAASQIDVTRCMRIIYVTKSPFLLRLFMLTLKAMFEA